MQFTWGFGCANVAKTINTMIKYKSGGWTSFKQRSYVSSRLLPVADAAFPRDAANAKMFGVELHDGEFGMILEGYTKWADYGRKSIRRSGWFYVMDDTGVLRKYKLGYRYEDNGNFSEPDSAKTKLEWQRPPGIKIDVFEPPPAVVSKSKFIGNEGERVNTTVILKRVIDRGIGDFGRMYLSVFETNEGDVIMYHNCLRGGLEGKTYNVNFTVKKHILTYKNEKVTVASRMGFSTNQKLLNRIAA